MDIFGLTPIDSALAAWGLNCAQVLVDFLFKRTQVGLAALVIGFLGSLWQSAREGNLKHFVTFVFICLIGPLLFITPTRHEPAVKSAVEVYGSSSVSAKSIKDTQTNAHTMPLMLSFVGQAADMVSVGIVFLIDNSLSNDTHFLKNPFDPQKLALEANQIIHAPIADPDLKRDVDDFIYAVYLPSLIINKNDSGVFDHSEDLKNQLKNLMIPIEKIRILLNQLGSASNNMDDQIIKSIIRGQIDQHKSLLIWPFASILYSFFPYILGWANFCLYIFFPVLMLMIMVFRRLSLFLRYLEVFCWIKSWVLGAAIAYYMSMLMAHLQAQSSVSANWLWDYPYFVLLSVFLLCLMPVLTGILTRRLFQQVNHHL